MSRGSRNFLNFFFTFTSRSPRGYSEIEFSGSLSGKEIKRVFRQYFRTNLSGYISVFSLYFVEVNFAHEQAYRTKKTGSEDRAWTFANENGSVDRYCLTMSIRSPTFY